MVAAALTPRVRILAICDAVTPSEIEDRVFTLEGVRQHLFAEVFPCYRDFTLFLLLSNPRRGRYEGWVRVVRNQNTRIIRYAPFVAAFRSDNQLVPLYVEVEQCRFTEVGEYSFEVWFRSKNGEAAQKGEQPFGSPVYKCKTLEIRLVWQFRTNGVFCPTSPGFPGKP